MKNSGAQRTPVLVAGVGQTGPVAEDPRSIAEMALEAVQAALDDAGVGYEAIDAVVTASVDLFDGLTASNIAVTEVVGAVMKPETRIAADGLGAAIHASCQIWAEAYESVLVVAHGKVSMSDFQALTTWAMDPIYLQPLGLDFLTCAGLEANSLSAKDAGAQSRWARIVASRRKAAGQNGLLPECSAEEALASPIVASPLRSAMCAPMGDGACAVLLRRADSAPDAGRGVVIGGVGHDLSSHAHWDAEFAMRPGLGRASRRAYALAGIDDPASAFDLLEPSCLYPHEEDLFLEATGIGTHERISPGGGLFAGYAPVTAGLSRLIAATRRMREEPDCNRALVHGAWGPVGQGQVVAILEAAR